MTYGPVMSGQIGWETMGTVRDFIFLGSKISADDATLMAESEEELKSLLMKVKERVKKFS